jgi:hypothetical protein
MNHMLSKLLEHVPLMVRPFLTNFLSYNQFSDIEKVREFLDQTEIMIHYVRTGEELHAEEH